MKIKISLLSALFLLILATSKVSASEGTAELRNIVGEDARCVTYSVLMQNNQYSILLNCRDILYPGGTSIFQYVVWAQPLGGGNPTRLGTVGLGKKEFNSKTPFSGLFITKESTDKPRSPEGPVIMQGNVRSNELLEAPADDRPIEIGSPNEEPVVTPTPEPENQGSSLATRLLIIGGIIAFLALFGVVFVIFVITRR